MGFGHAVLPDHWVPLAVVGRTQRYALAKVAGLSGLAAAAHVVVSVALGAVIVLIGLQFQSRVERAQDAIIGGLLIATGIGFAAIELTGHRHGHDHGHPHDHEHRHPRTSSLATVVVPFGAAASPDLTVLPVFLAATSAGAGVAIGSLFVFAAATIGTIVLLTLIAAAGGRQIRGQWLERWANVITAAVLIVIGALVLAGLL